MDVAFRANFAVAGLVSLFHRQSGKVDYRLEIATQSLLSTETILVYGITKTHLFVYDLSKSKMFS